MNQLDEWICAEFQNLAQVLYEYDSNLRLEMIPPSEWGNLIDKSKVFKIIDTARNQIVMHFDSLKAPNEILAAVWCADQRVNNPIARMEKENQAAELLRLSRQMDEEEARKDFFAFVGKNQKSRWHHDGRVRDEHYNDLGPVSKVID